MAAPLRDRLSFLSRLPVLLRGTADDDTPCPGYLFEEIAKISHESPGSSQCLLEHLLTRLQSSSCHVKLKVLKILLHTCSQGSPHFVLQLKRNASFIREAAAFSGPPDPLHGNSLNQKVRAAAQDLAKILFSDAPLPQPLAPGRPPAPAGMGSSPSPCGSLQGFGFSSDKSGSASTGEALLSSLQRAAEAVAQAVLPAPGGPRQLRGDLPEDTYEPVRAPSPASSPAPPPPSPPAPRASRASHQPGLPGGGWEEADSGHSSRESSQGHERSRASDSGSKSGSDSRSGASRELSHGPDGRVDADSPGDCRRELSLVSALTRGARVFLTREEAQHFLKECGLLNCEVVLELLGRALEDPSDSVRMRSMCAISALGCSDLLSPEQIFAVTQQRLQHLSQGSPGPVANRATKMLRQFEALCRAQPSPRAPRPPSAPSAGSAGDLLMDIPAVPGGTFLTPLSPAPTPAAAAEEPGVASEPPGQPGAAVPACPCGQGGGSRLAGDTAAPGLSLFAGMELVARPGTALRPRSPPVEPQDGGTDTEGTLQPSAFPFLNM
ncbi:AP-4 complex accessory subunit tepsin isoform X3 [Passer montanus]|uniref:AP-4 complex accessory subunit tepsin isoform X3 n=1 Tax=Passer montanus TaxID=9160 RepID=UPI0019612762|nr:AP-4 complex accessory subunit tepsin isoform X3 [Passer montanus]